MADTNFVDQITVIEASWLNAINDFYYTLFSGATTAAGARTAIGLGSIATQASGNVAITGGSITGITDLAVADGGTGASTAAAARSSLGAQQDVITTRGDLVVGNSTPAASRLALGSNGQVLSNDGTDVVWRYGGWEPVDYVDLTSLGAVSSADLLLSGDSNYEDMLVVAGMSSNTGGNWFSSLHLRNTGGTWRTANYVDSFNVITSTGVNNSAQSAFLPYYHSGYTGNGAGLLLSIEARFKDAGLSGKLTSAMFDSFLYDSITAARGWGGGVLNQTEAHDQVRINLSAGTFDSGYAATYKRRIIS